MSFFCPKKLSNIRKERGFKTIEGLAIALKKYIPTVSKMTIHHWENSGRTPSYRYLMALCRVLNVEPHELSIINKIGDVHENRISKSRRSKK